MPRQNLQPPQIGLVERFRRRLALLKRRCAGAGSLAAAPAAAPNADLALLAARVAQVEAGVRGAQTSLSGEVANLSRAVESQAAELRQMGQLLQASFSLGLALQEQQARTAEENMVAMATCLEANRFLVDARRERSCIALPYPDLDPTVNNILGLIRRKV